MQGTSESGIYYHEVCFLCLLPERECVDLLSCAASSTPSSLERRNERIKDKLLEDLFFIYSFGGVK